MRSPPRAFPPPGSTPRSMPGSSRDVYERLECRHAQAPLRRPRALRQRSLPPAPQAPADPAHRHRRSPLHLRVGPQFPPGLPQARENLPPPENPARPLPNRHRHAQGRPRHPQGFPHRRRRPRAAQFPSARISTCASRPAPRASGKTCCWKNSPPSMAPPSFTSPARKPPRRSPLFSPETASPPAPIMPACPPSSAPMRRARSWPATPASSSPPSPSAWASTNPTSAPSSTTTSRKASKTTPRKSAAPVATACPRSARC